MLPTTTALNQFQLGFPVTDLARSVRFYQVLFGRVPAAAAPEAARFELLDPPLALTLFPGQRAEGQALNHVGLRLPDSAALVDIQRRLEENGIPTQRQEGVECCYARQTKFWVKDPDRNLWELYIFEEDLDHSGFEDHTQPKNVELPARIVWEHRLTDPVPDHLAHAAGSVDEARLEGTFNGSLDDSCLARLLTEVRRVLRPQGKLLVHALVGDRPFPGTPALPGLAALVRRVPTLDEVTQTLRQAGFSALFFDQFDDVHCFQVAGVELRHMRLVATSVSPSCSPETRAVMYKGPMARVTDEDGNVYQRGEVLSVPTRTFELLRRGPAAKQFVLL